MNEKVLLIFIRNPELGKVKTRLAATVGDENALKVYEALLEYTKVITQDLPCRKVLYYADKITEKDRWPDGIYDKALQPEGDLGLKMETAFSEAFQEGARQVVLIGSDCYELTSEILDEAYKQLKTKDAVIGPATDGGYYLLGFSRPDYSVFLHKNWSTNTVFQDTVNDLETNGFSWSELPVLNDVDEEKDLGELRKLLT